MSLEGLTAFEQPKNLSDALGVLEKYGDGTLVVAGGTFIHGLISRGLIADVDAILDISQLPLSDVSYQKKTLSIGAAVTYGDLLKAEQVQTLPAFGAIKDALGYPPPQIVNVATIGGCLASSSPLFDLPTAISALGGILKASSAKAEKTYNLDEFFIGLFESALADNELITSINIKADEKSTSGFAKLETNANDLALINTAVSLTFKTGLLNRTPKCIAARVFVGGGVGETVMRAPSVEKTLAGGAPLTDEIISKAISSAHLDVTAQGDHRASAKYRQKMIEVYLKKAIARALKRAGN